MEVCGGLFGCIRAVAMIEEHGSGKQVFRLRAWARIPRVAIGLLMLLGFIATLAAFNQALLVALVLTLGLLGTALIIRAECSKAMQVWIESIAKCVPADTKSAEAGSVFEGLLSPIHHALNRAYRSALARLKRWMACAEL
jgi:hypothetical protein